MEVNNRLASQYSIRTSDRRTFRRCMRKWDFQSSLRQNLTHTGSEQNINFWFGSAIHFSLEDYHGLNQFQDPRRALYEYYHAFKDEDMPMGAEMNYPLGLSMLTYYLTWMPRHNQQTGFETAWMDPNTYAIMPKGAPGAIPAVEISFYIPLNVYAVVDADDNKIGNSFYFNKETETLEHLQMTHPDLPKDWSPDNDPDWVYNVETGMPIKIIGVNYHGTIDRIVVDRYGRYWLWDYKTAKKADTAKLATDDQVSAYLWAAKKIFPFAVYGFVYLQLVKEAIKEPRRLKNGTLSVDKRQRTTYGLLRQAIIEDYGDVNAAPSNLIQFLNVLAAQEEPEGDRFIRWDFVKRTDEQLLATEKSIYGELGVMLNPTQYCYPSPTRDCIWDCPFRDACIMLDMNDTDAYQEFMVAFEERPHREDGNMDDWRQAIAWPTLNSEGQPILVDMEEIMNFNSALVIADNEDNEGKEDFEFYYEEPC
ncbi:MAG: PD-(D/E)XK nuclease family protein [Tannerellaceae bacterium]